MRKSILFLALLCINLHATSAEAIGMRTHAQIAQMAVEEYLAEAILLPGLSSLFTSEENLRALYSGCAFPDWGYGGIHPDAAEFSHWHPFMEAYIHVLKQRFPPPWDEEAQRQVCFFLGVMSHNMSDIPWHFSEEEHRSFLQAGLEEDGAGHSDIEYACDIFLYAQNNLTPAVGGEAWFPLDLLPDIFQQAGKPVSRWQLIQGTARSRVMFWGGWMAAMLQFNAQKAKMPWVYQHYGDYYYGGMRHGAAITAVMARHVYARLNGIYYYQNTPEYAAYVRRDKSYVPYLQFQDAHIMADTPGNNTGGASFIEVGGAGQSQRVGLIHIDLAEIPKDTPIESAHLWLYRSESDAPHQTAPTLQIHRVLKPWQAGAGASDSLLDITGRKAAPSEVSWNHTGDSPWKEPGCTATDMDYDSEAISTLDLSTHPASSRWIRMDITNAVAEWVKDPQSNFGLSLRAKDGDAQSVPIRFYSSEAFRSDDSGYCGGTQIAYRPALIVTPSQVQ